MATTGTLTGDVAGSATPPIHHDAVEKNRERPLGSMRRDGCGRHGREADYGLRRAAAACAPLPRDAWLGLRGKLSSHCESVTGWLAGFTAHSNRFMIQSTVFNVKLELM